MRPPPRSSPRPCAPPPRSSSRLQDCHLVLLPSTRVAPSKPPTASSSYLLPATSATAGTRPTTPLLLPPPGDPRLARRDLLPRSPATPVAKPFYLPPSGSWMERNERSDISDAALLVGANESPVCVHQGAPGALGRLCLLFEQMSTAGVLLKRMTCKKQNGR